MKPRILRSLQLYRVIALIMVYIFHQGVADEAWSRLGVCFFFVISGFLTIYRDYGKNCMDTGSLYSCLRYSVSKIRRLIPLHVIMLVTACSLYVISVWDFFREELALNISRTLIKFILNLLLVSDWVPHTSGLSSFAGEYNIATWFLSACLMFYILTPLIIRIMRRLYDAESYRSMVHRVWVVSGAVYVFTVITNLCFMRVSDPGLAFWLVYESPISRLGDYLIGCNLGLLYLRNTEDLGLGDMRGHTGLIWTIILALCSAVSAVLLYVGIAVVPDNMKLIISGGFYFTLPVAGMILAGAMLDRFIPDDMERHTLWRLVMWIAAISPYAYLIQVPVINLVHGIYKRIGEVNIWIWSAISVIITLVTSELYRLAVNKQSRLQRNEDG